MLKKDYNNYDYITVSVKEEKYDPIIRCYEKLGWERVKSREDAVYYNLVTVVFRRPHKITKKDRLQLLQVWMESQINEISTASAEKHAVSVSSGIILYLIYSALIVCGMLMSIFAKTPTFTWIGVALAVLGISFATITVAPLYKRVKRERAVYEERFERASRQLESYIEEADALAYERQLYETELLNSQNEQFEEQLNQSLFDDQTDDGATTDGMDGANADEQGECEIEGVEENAQRQSATQDGDQTEIPTEPQTEPVAEQENATEETEDALEENVEQTECESTENVPEEIATEKEVCTVEESENALTVEEKESGEECETLPENDDSQGIFAHEMDFDDQNVQVVDSTFEVDYEEIETFVDDEETHVDGEILELTIEENFADENDGEKADQAPEKSVDEGAILDGADEQTGVEENRESGVIDNE